MGNKSDRFKAIARYQWMSLLCTMAPDAPFPLRLAEHLLEGDALVDGPNVFVADNFPAARHAAMELTHQYQMARHVTVDDQSITITTPGQQALQALFAEIPKPKRSRVGEMLSDVSGTMIVSIYEWASYLPEATIAPDPADHIPTREELALLPPHVLAFARHIHTDEPHEYLQALTDLWLLNSHKVVPEAWLLPRTQEWIEKIGSDTTVYDGPEVIHFLQIVEEMITAAWPHVHTFAPALLKQAKDVHQGTPREWRIKGFTKMYQTEAKRLKTLSDGA